MRQPEGVDDKSEKVCRLKRALYGLKQSSRVWNDKLNEVLLKKMKFSRPSYDLCYEYTTCQMRHAHATLTSRENEACERHVPCMTHYVMYHKFAEYTTCRFCHKVCHFHMPTMTGMCFFRHVSACEMTGKFADYTTCHRASACYMPTEQISACKPVCEYTACHKTSFAVICVVLSHHIVFFLNDK